MASSEVLESSEIMDSGLNDALSAPQGWTKKLMPRKSGTPKRKEVVFIAPNGEEVKNKKQLDKYLKAYPGSTSSADFDWSTGESPRRSARLSGKGRLSSGPADGEPAAKRSKRSLESSKGLHTPARSTTPSRKGRKSQTRANPPKDEVMEEAEELPKAVDTSDTTPTKSEGEEQGVDKLKDENIAPASTLVETSDQLENQPAQKPMKLDTSDLTVNDPGFKVIAEEQGLLPENPPMAAVTTGFTSTVEETTASSRDMPMVELTGVEDSVTLLESVLLIPTPDINNMTSFSKDASVVEENSEVEEACDTLKKQLTNPLLNCDTKEEDLLKSKDHQGIRALVEEP